MSGMTSRGQMKILEVIESCLAGVGRHVSSLCDGLAVHGHRVTVAYSPYRADEAFRRFIADHRDEIRFVPLSVGREVSPASDLHGVGRLLRLMRREGPFDVVHGHSSKGGAIGRIAGRLSGIPTVYTPNSLIVASPDISKPSAAVYSSIEYVLGRLATSRIIAVSEDERELFLKLRLVSPDRVAVIEQAIHDHDLEGFPEEGGGKELSRKPLTFGATMRFEPQKAPAHLVEAFVRLAEALPQLPMRLVVAGDGELFAEAKKQAEESGMGEKISLLGWRTDIREVLREIDVFVVPSLYESGLTYSTMEAMAARLPIVSTNVFGTRGTLSRLPGNVLVPVGDPAALAEGMRGMATLADAGSLRRELRRIGQANRDYVRANCMQSDITRRTIELYRALG